MSRESAEETRSFWNSVARDWDIQVGEEGDSNRILNSDPVLWAFAGDVSVLNVLDAGCGTGYLSRKLREKGANVIGIDFSEKMITIARSKDPDLDYRVDSCSELKTVDSSSQDMVIANYVLMDTSDLEGTMRAFNRVLKPYGTVVVVFSHPCFPQGRASVSAGDNCIEYSWTFGYFEQNKCVDPPWAHFKSDFIWFHRPLSDYWKAFKTSGFDVTDFEEPRVDETRYHLAENERKLRNSRSRPYSVAFRLKKVKEE